MKYTSKFSLKKPDGTDFANIEDINENFDKIDKYMGMDYYLTIPRGVDIGSPNMQLVFIENPNSSSKQVTVGTWLGGIVSNEPDKKMDLTINARSVVCAVVYSGKFGIISSNESKYRSESISYIGYQYNYHVYSVDGVGLIRIN